MTYDNPKGHKFVEDDIPKGRRRHLNDAQKKLWCEEQTKRYKIVARNKDDSPIIAEELDSRFVNSVSNVKVRRIVGTLLHFQKEERAEAIAMFNEDGTPKYPFKGV